MVFFHGSLLFSQSIEYNQQFLLESRPIIFRNITFDEDSLLITGEIGTDSSGLQGIFILHMDTFGNLGMVKLFNDPEQFEQMHLNGSNPVIKNENNIVLSGEFAWKSDNYLILYNKISGSYLYQEYSSPFLVRFTESLLELSGEFYVVGYIQTQDFDLDIFLQKIDSSGNKIWEKTYGIPSKDETGRAVIIEDGGLTIMISESFDNTPNIKNDTRYWIRFMHVDTSGAIVRDWREEVTGQEGWAGSLLKYNNDYIYSTNVIGEETNFGPLVASQIVRRDSDFNVIWRKPFGAPDNHHNQIGDMIFSRDSSMLLASGNIWDSTQQFTWARVMMVDLCGDLSCEVRDTGIFIPNLGSSNRLEGIVQSESGSIYTVGYTYKSSGFYEGLLLKINMDGCIDTLCTTTAIENLIRRKEDIIRVYPNPTSSDIHIQMQNIPQGPVKISIYDQLGVLLKSYSLSSGEIDIDVSFLSGGLYLITAESGGKKLGTTKVLKLDK